MGSQGEDINYEELRKNARKGAIKSSKKASSSNTTTYIAVGIFGLLVAAVIGVLVLNPEQPLHLVPALDTDFMETQNSLRLGYTQKPNSFFQGWSLADVTLIAQNGFSQSAKNIKACHSYRNEGELVPISYDLRDEFPHCIQEIQNQGNCSSSYAIAVASVASEKFCMMTNGKFSPVLSAQDIVSCSKKNSGCASGNIDSAWNYVKDTGIVEESCFSYSSVDMKAPECSSKCDMPGHKVSEVCATASEAGVMREIKKNGPVVGLMQIYSDFLGYSYGVYEPHLSATRVHGRVSVEIIGWGTSDDGVPYWIIKNSWGTAWGEGGYAQVVRGNKDLGLDDFVLTAIPVISEDMVTTEPGVILDEFEDLDTKTENKE